MISSIANRQDTFLAQDEWTALPFRGKQVSTLQQLLNLVVKLPALLNRFDEIKARPNSTTFAAVEKLRSDLRDFIQRLWAWEVTLDSQTSWPSSWSKPSPYDSSLSARDVLWYPNITTANSLTYSWAFGIIARTQLTALYEATTKAQDSNGYTPPQTPNGFANERPIEALAEMICDSMSYLMQPEFKLYGPGSAFFTLPTAMKVFESQPERCSSHLLRCQHTLDRLASIGVFYPLIY